MKIVIVGGTGRIGSRVAAKLTGHQVVIASPSTGVDSVTGAGLGEALAGTDVLLDVTRPRIYDAESVRVFFTRSTANLLREGAKAGVRHHIALTPVGTQHRPTIPYYAAKRVQEELIRASGQPYTLVHATQVFEFLGEIADVATVEDTVRLPGIIVQPIAADDVADALVETASALPLNGDIRIAGPDRLPLDDFVRRGLVARNDSRRVLRDPRALYFGGRVGTRDLLPGRGARVFPTHLEALLSLLRDSATTGSNPLPEDL